MSEYPMAVVTAVACVALALPALAYALTARPGVARQRALTNLNRELSGASAAHPGPEVQGRGLADLARRVTPLASVQMIDRLLGRAGRPAAWPLERVLVTKLLLTAGVAALAVLMVRSDPSLRTTLIWAGATGIAWVVPELLLYNTAKKRQEAIQHALPDTLDQLTIAVEAGLGFEAAMSQTARNSRGPLPDELVRTLQDIQVGQPRRQAYLGLAERTQVTDLSRFVRAIIQADAHGVSIARVLSTQAHEMRLKRRQRAEEKAMQIPIKVIFPLILCILPVLFIVVLGPAAINIVEGFSGT